MKLYMILLTTTITLSAPSVYAGTVAPHFPVFDQQSDNVIPAADRNDVKATQGILNRLSLDPAFIAAAQKGDKATLSRMIKSACPKCDVESGQISISKSGGDKSSSAKIRFCVVAVVTCCPWRVKLIVKPC